MRSSFRICIKKAGWGLIQSAGKTSSIRCIRERKSFIHINLHDNSADRAASISEIAKAKNAYKFWICWVWYSAININAWNNKKWNRGAPRRIIFDFFKALYVDPGNSQARLGGPLNKADPRFIFHITDALHLKIRVETRIFPAFTAGLDYFLNFRQSVPCKHSRF